jgi:hypothetical protein
MRNMWDKKIKMNEENNFVEQLKKELRIADIINNVKKQDREVKNGK